MDSFIESHDSIVLALSAPHSHGGNVALAIGSDGHICSPDHHSCGLETDGQPITAPDQQQCPQKRKAPEAPSEPGSSSEAQTLVPQTDNVEFETTSVQRSHHSGTILQEVQAQQRRARMIRGYIQGPPLPPGLRLAALAYAAGPRPSLHGYQSVRPSWDWATRLRTNRTVVDERRSINLARARRSRLLSQVQHNMELARIIGPFLRYGRPDVHRDLRLDVDNMTHEELVALQERIGDANAGLSEEIIVERLRWREYQSTDKDDSCAICLENYIDGDEFGVLDCRHEFHLVCVKQWLRVKNICPICKMTALAE